MEPNLRLGQSKSTFANLKKSAPVRVFPSVVIVRIPYKAKLEEQIQCPEQQIQSPEQQIRNPY